MKRQQSLIDGPNPYASTPSNPLSTPTSSTPPSFYANLKVPSHGPIVALGLPSTSTPSKKDKNNVNCLQNQA